MRIKTKTAIIFVWDEERKEPRQVMFGDNKKLFKLLMGEFARSYLRLKELIDLDPKTKKQLEKAIEKTSTARTVHGRGAFGKKAAMHILEYEIK